MTSLVAAILAVTLARPVLAAEDLTTYVFPKVSSSSKSILYIYLVYC